MRKAKTTKAAALLLKTLLIKRAQLDREFKLVADYYGISPEKLREYYNRMKAGRFDIFGAAKDLGISPVDLARAFEWLEIKEEEYKQQPPKYPLPIWPPGTSPVPGHPVPKYDPYFTEMLKAPAPGGSFFKRLFSFLKDQVQKQSQEFLESYRRNFRAYHETLEDFRRRYEELQRRLQEQEEKEQETNPFDSPRPLRHKYPDMRII